MSNGASYSIHELFHVTSVATEFVETHLLNHPSACHLPADTLEKLEEACSLLARAYTDIGAFHISGED